MNEPAPFPKSLPWLILGAFTAVTAFYISAIDADLPAARDPAAVPVAPTASAIRHLVVVIPENHSFDSYYGRYCHAMPGSNPSCVTGRDCCEAGPAQEPGRHSAPIVLDDRANSDYDPNHSQACELLEINRGRMDGYVSNARCGDRRNFAYATEKSASTYWKLADGGALADRYFQPIAGASSSNDMYFARAQYVFTDNLVEPDSIGSKCGAINENRHVYDDATIGDLLANAGVSWAFYAEGYHVMQESVGRGACPKPDPRCSSGQDEYPCIYDPSDNPFQYYRKSLDNMTVEKDYSQFAHDLEDGTLPSVSFVKPLGFRTEHPGSNISDGMKFLGEVVQGVESSQYAADTLVLITPDESGGFFDHISPPGKGSDGKPYGPRIPLLALGKFARKGHVSHVQMEHSSIVRFIEWNWLKETGGLKGRDAVVNGIGSMLDPEQTG